MAVDRWVVTSDLKTKLASALSGIADVYVAEAPTASRWAGTPGRSNYTPYAVLWPLQPNRDGTIGDPNGLADFRYQLSCVGATVEQAERLADIAAEALYGSPLGTAFVTWDTGGGTERDDDVDPPVFVAVERFRVID